MNINNYKKLISRINILEKGIQKKQTKINELQRLLNDDLNELKKLNTFKDTFEKASSQLDEYFTNKE